MKKYVLINGKIKKFKKKITVSADKSLSIRWVLMAAQAVGQSIAYKKTWSKSNQKKESLPNKWCRS